MLQGIVRQDWVEQADWSTLERVNGEHVARHRERRSSDMVWRVQGRSGWEYVYLLFEFQSRSDASASTWKIRSSDSSSRSVSSASMVRPMPYCRASC